MLIQKGAVAADKPLRQTKLRPLMAEANSAKFFGNAASTNSTGMVGTLLQIAGMRGLIEVAGESGDYLVWLKPTETSSSQVFQVESPANRQPNAEPPANKEAGALILESVGKPAVNQPEITPALKERRTRQPDKYRSDMYSDYIRKAKMGPFPVARLEVYKALDKIVGSNPKRSLSSLIEAAINSAKPLVPEGQPWEAIRHVTQNQLLKAQVALDEHDKPLPDRWDSGMRIVHRLAKDWENRATGEILLALFESVNVTGDDIVNVCRSVWGSSSSEALAKLYQVMKYLTDVVRAVVEEDKSGIFRVKRQQPDAHPAPSSPRTERVASEVDETKVLDDAKDVIQ